MRIPLRNRRIQLKRLQKKACLLAVIASCAAVVATYDTLLKKDRVHTSILSGSAWVNELLKGHHSRIYSTLRVQKHVFKKLVETLRLDGNANDSKRVKLEEQVAIFLYISATGLPIRQAAERFQRSYDTIHRFVV